MSTTPHRFQPGTPFDDMLAHLNDNFDSLDDQDRVKIIKNRGVPQLLLGFQQGGFLGLDYGLKVSKIDPSTGAPYDVTSAPDDQLAFTSAFNTLRIVKTGILSVSTSGDEFQSSSVLHGLSGPKMLVGYAESDWNPGVFFPVPYIQNDASFSNGASIDWQANMYINATHVVAEVTAVVATGAPANTYDGTTRFRYYLLQETAN